tara:strand:+ start:407 stop:670 length:264 start_codon:yes stop_codon:yes gene_type:complete
MGHPIYPHTESDTKLESNDKEKKVVSTRPMFVHQNDIEKQNQEALRKNNEKLDETCKKICLIIGCILIGCLFIYIISIILILRDIKT